MARRGLPSGVVLVLAARAPDTVEHPHWDSALRDLAGHEGVTTTDLPPLPGSAVPTPAQVDGPAVRVTAGFAGTSTTTSVPAAGRDAR